MNAAIITIRPTKPSFMKLLLVALLSVAATVLTLFLLVLPAVYGIDPTGFGTKLGLADKSSPITSAVLKSAKSEAITPVQTAASQPMPNLAEQASPNLEAHQETFVLTVAPKQNLSFTIYMERDYDLDYHWATDGKPLYAELRGENPTIKNSKVKVFGKLTESKAKGFFIPPFTGNYSLYWENKTDKAITVRLTAKGVYKVIN